MTIEKRNFTSATGEETITFTSNSVFDEHQMQIEVSAQPATGTLAVAVKTPGATDFSTIESSVDMTGITATVAKIVQFSGLIEAVKFTPATLEAGKTYSVYMASWKK